MQRTTSESQRRTSNRDGQDLCADYFSVRRYTEALCQTLDVEDMVAQSMPDCSSTKWHLAHTTWFFEQFVLTSLTEYRPRHPLYAQLFNSYYRSVGPSYPRQNRGLLSRPTMSEVLAYRRHVDAAVLDMLSSDRLAPALESRVVVGLHHEQQHQELLLTDILHLFSMNPLEPVYRRVPIDSEIYVTPMTLHRFEGGQIRAGATSEHFSFDNERPAHERYVTSFQLANRLVTNAEYCAFIADGGYQREGLWLAEGWEVARAAGWCRPLYWDDTLSSHFTLGGRLSLDPTNPVSHVSYYEADAYARWRGVRLPREDEWESVAKPFVVEGNLLESGSLRPLAAANTTIRVAQLFGDVWEWTQSPYTPYPGFVPDAAPLDEYNGKFMINQQVLRGGSCLSPARHIRSTYRNFLPPAARWQVTGIRIAADA